MVLGAVSLEKTLEFADRLIGILNIPDDRIEDCPVLFINGWTGNCAGPHRMLKLWAKNFSLRGNPSLRFDFRGRGDSPGEELDKNIYSMAEDTLAAAECLRKQVGRMPAVLISICSGSLVALHLVKRLRPERMILLSPEAELRPEREQVARELRRTTAYVKQYIRKLFCVATWRKILRGEVHWRIIFFGVLRLDALGRYFKWGVARKQNAAPVGLPVHSRSSAFWLDELEGFEGRVLVTLGGQDPGRDEVRMEFGEATKRMGADVEIWIDPLSDRLFTSTRGMQRVFDVAQQWLQREM